MDAEAEAFAYYAEAVAADPALGGVASLPELHERLAALSAPLAAADEDGGSVFAQLTFPASAADGAHPNPVFAPHPFKRDVGTDGQKIQRYYRYAVKDAEHVAAALEYACDKQPSLILEPAHPAEGALYHGGYKCVSSLRWLQQQEPAVRLIVNTAGNIGAVFPSFNKWRAAAADAGIEVLELVRQTPATSFLAVFAGPFSL